MKKTYIVPAIVVMNIQSGNVMQAASQITVDGTISSGSADTRGVSGWDDED